MGKTVDCTNDIRIRNWGKDLKGITQNIKQNDKNVKNMIIFKAG